MHRLKLKSLLGRIVGWSQWEGNISLFILGFGGGGGGGDFFKFFVLLLCVGWFFSFGLSSCSSFNIYILCEFCCPLFFFLFIYFVIIILRDCPFFIFGAQGGKKGAILRTVDSPHCKCNGGGGKSFFPMCFGRR
jgi:hypothetical protein